MVCTIGGFGSGSEAVIHSTSKYRSTWEESLITVSRPGGWTRVRQDRGRLRVGHVAATVLP